MLLAIGRQNAVPLVGLDWKDEDDAALEWLQTLGNPYSVVAIDKDGRTAIEFGVYGAPETFFIDAAGRIQYRHVGPMTAEIWKSEFLSRLPRGGVLP
jgi:cytochrome c biogenesis protein CcmG/thiol:disulfide interchange protein DsbE